MIDVHNNNNLIYDNNKTEQVKIEMKEKNKEIDLKI